MTETPAALRFNGTVAVGAPLANASLSFSCVQGGGANLATTDSAGSYFANVQAIAPCIITATGTVNGTPTTLHGAASEAGVANVTPLTQIVLAALGVDPLQANADQLRGLTSESLTGAWTTTVQPLLEQLGVSLSDHPGTTPFAPVAGNAIDDALEALQTKGVNADVLQQLAKSADAQALPGTLQAAADAQQRQACSPTAENPMGSCWRVQTPSQPEVRWTQVAGSNISLGGKDYAIVDSGEGYPMIQGFSRTFTSNYFTMQLCSAENSGSAPKLKYQLISPLAKLVTETEWNKIIEKAFKEDPTDSLKFTLQQDCTMLSGEDPALTNYNTSKEVSRLAVHADGSATNTSVDMRDGQPYSYTEHFTKEQLNAWFFRGQPIGGDDQWKTYAQLYQIEEEDGPLFAVSLSQKPNASTSFEQQPEMFGAGFFIEWDGYR